MDTTDIGLFWYPHITLGFIGPWLENSMLMYSFGALIFKILLPQENVVSGGLKSTKHLLLNNGVLMARSAPSNIFERV